VSGDVGMEQLLHRSRTPLESASTGSPRWRFRLLMGTLAPLTLDPVGVSGANGSDQ
jgi:hypothetical protein